MEGLELILCHNCVECDHWYIVPFKRHTDGDLCTPLRHFSGYVDSIVMSKLMITKLTSAIISTTTFPLLIFIIHLEGKFQYDVACSVRVFS